MYFQPIYRFEVDLLKNFAMSLPPEQSHYPDSPKQSHYLDSPDICCHYPNSLFAELHSCFCNQSSCWFHYQNRNLEESLHCKVVLQDRVHTAKQNQFIHALR